jgi:nucleoside-diphosphate-sugar epimerase
MCAEAQGNLSGKRLVIFGCGYVGTAVAGAAQKEGAQVTALTRNTSHAAALVGRGIEAVIADLATDDWHERIPAAPDLVLNAVSAGGGGIEGYRRSYVEGMRSIGRWARRYGQAGTFVYTGSTAVYPQGGGVIVDETALTAADGERARLLLEAETLVRESPQLCHRWFILRLSGIYGPARHHLLDQVRSGTVSGVAENRVNMVHRDDIVAAVLACFRAPPAVQNEIFNVADDQPARKAEVAAWLAAAIHVPTPRFSGEPVGGRERVVPDRLISNRKLKATLGWRPRYPSFREGYEALLASPEADR